MRYSLIFLMLVAYAGYRTAEFLETPRQAPLRDTLSGPARVVDGDTLVVGRSRVRLHGIDAPESKQSCVDHLGRAWPAGHEATRRLRATIANRPVTCTAVDRDRYQRVVGVCQIEGHDLGRAMVVNGWAMAYRRYSMRYAAAENRARKAGRGIWDGRCQAPWQWRATRSSS